MNISGKIIGDFHVHTRYSKDSNMSVKLCLKRFKKLGYTHIAITDHNTFKGYLEAKKVIKDINLNIIPGCEIKTSCCEIISLLTDDNNVITYDALECIDRIHECGGIAVIAHPYRSRYITSSKPKEYSIPQEVLKRVDLIEVVNSRNKRKDNEKCLKLAIDLKKNYIGGSDTHFLFEVGNCKVIYQVYSDDIDEIKKIILKNNPIMYDYSNSIKNILANILSYIVKKLKR